MSETLHREDFYAWTQQQAEALRARRLESNAIDWERVAEEIGEMGSEVRHACEAFVALIIEHLMKLSATRSVYPVDHWRTEVDTFRLNLLTRVTPSIRNELLADMERLHERGAKRALKALRRKEPHAQLDPTLRWTWDEITGEGGDDPLDLDYPRPPNGG